MNNKLWKLYKDQDDEVFEIFSLFIAFLRLTDVNTTINNGRDNVRLAYPFNQECKQMFEELCDSFSSLLNDKFDDTFTEDVLKRCVRNQLYRQLNEIGKPTCEDGVWFVDETYVKYERIKEEFESLLHAIDVFVYLIC